MRFYKILKAKQCGNAEGLTAYERQFVEYLKKIDIKTLTGVLPLTFTAKGGTAADWVIYGNDNNGTEQLFDKSASTSDKVVGNNGAETTSYGRSHSDYIPVTTGPYYVSNILQANQFYQIVGFDENKQFTKIYNFTPLSYTAISGVVNVEETTKYIIINYQSTNENDVSVTKGSTAPDHYIPYQQGVGERTKNLFDVGKLTDKVESGETLLHVENGVIYVSTSATSATTADGSNHTLRDVCGAIDAGVPYTLKATSTGKTKQIYLYNAKIVWAFGETKTFSSANIESIRNSVILYYASGVSTSAEITNIMLVKGSTAPDHYIPYGYEIPIYSYSSNLPQIKKDLIGAKVHETQVTSRKGNETLTWDVIGIDHDECYYADGRRAAHSVTLQLHDCFASLQFDEREALFYAESAMPAGTYHFTVREQPWYASDVGKTFQFTLTQTLAAGSQICITNAYNAAMTSGKIKTFSDGSSTTAIETVDITEGSDGTDLGDVRNALVGQNTNSIQRALFGSNNWANSAMRQCLNSSAAAGGVWTPKTKFDRPPSWVSSIAGFLNGMDEDFVKAVGTVKKTTALNTVTDGGGKVESDEKFFLLSRSEVYGGNEVAGGEGAAYSYYADYSDLSGAGTGADTNRIKYRNNAAQYWWLRSPGVPGAGSVRGVYTTGGVYNYGAITSYGVAPAICIPMDEVYDCNEVDIYIGDSPLTKGETVSKTSTGVDIELFEGENTVSTTLYNKPEMEIKYK